MKAVTVFFFLLFAVIVVAVDCPRGITNDPYPGICSDYVDADKDNYCDYSKETTEQSLIPQDGSLEITEQGQGTQLAERKGGTEYNAWQIAIILLIAYATSYFLVQFKKIKLLSHRKIWNIFLLVSFLVSGISGLLLAVKQSISIELPKESLFLHVETGIAMAIISIFHILWHWRYFEAIFSAKEKETKKQSVPNPKKHFLKKK